MPLSLVRLLAAAGIVAFMACGPGMTSSFAAENQAAAEDSVKGCIADLDAGFREEDGKYFFTMNFQNSCARPVQCSIQAYITSYRGPISAQTVLHLPAREQAPSETRYSIRVNANGGSAQYGRECQFE
jgi:hypothetical protein